MKQLLSKVPSWAKSFYFLATLFFLFWLSFMDSNDLFLQGELRGKHADLIEAKSFYEEKIIEVKNDREALLNNPELLEKLAREKYLMKKDREDVYVVVD